MFIILAAMPLEGAAIRPLRSKTTDFCEARETLLFIDVDGVLNVTVGAASDGSSDVDRPPLLLCKSNVVKALKAVARGDTDPSAQAIGEVYRRELGHGELSTFGKFVADDHSCVSSQFVARLADLIRAAGPQQQVILSSTWRGPEYAGCVHALEEEISKHLGEQFRFDGQTSAKTEDRVEERLELIGDFVAGHCKTSDCARLRVLVLDDFFSSPISGWVCGGRAVDSADDAAKYLAGRVRVGVDVTASVVHTCDEWTTDNGLTIRIGAGLTLETMCKALGFLGQRCGRCRLHGMRRRTRL